MRLFQAWHDRPIEKLLAGQSHRLTNIEQELRRMTVDQAQANADLKQAIVNLGAAVAGGTAKITSLAAQLLAAHASNDGTGVEEGAQQIMQMAASLNTAVAAAQPAPVVAAAPVTAAPAAAVDAAAAPQAEAEKPAEAPAAAADQPAEEVAAEKPVTGL